MLKKSISVKTVNFEYSSEFIVLDPSALEAYTYGRDIRTLLVKNTYLTTVTDMVIKKSYLLEQLQKSILPDEWNAIKNDLTLPISRFNRSVLLEMQSASVPDESDIFEDRISGLSTVIYKYLEEHLGDQTDGWKWINLSSIYLTFVVERPMHPIELLNIKVAVTDGQKIYMCPYKSTDKSTTCWYCVCRQLKENESISVELY